MTNAIEQAYRVGVIEPGDAVELPFLHDLGFLVGIITTRLQERGTIELVGSHGLSDQVRDFLRGLQMRRRAGSPPRWRLTRADGVTFEGPYALETLADRGQVGFEITISADGPIDETGAAPAASVDALKQAAIEALAETVATSAMGVVRKALESRAPGLELNEAQPAALVGLLSAVTGLIRAGDPDLDAAGIVSAVSDVLGELIGIHDRESGS